MALTTQTISTTLRVGIIAGQNYALINSYDSASNIIGFFSVENLSTGIKISTTSPNDGNNYTTGFTSEIHLTNLFVNPNINGPLSFYTDIESELNDQYNDTATVIINCISNISENNSTQELNFEIYDLLGRKTNFKENSILLYKYINGKVKKINTQKK